MSVKCLENRYMFFAYSLFRAIPSAYHFSLSNKFALSSNLRDLFSKFHVLSSISIRLSSNFFILSRI